MFKKILIANRGEIAVRVSKTAKRLGIQTVAVYSDADKAAPHVHACDEAVHIGGAAAADSYLNIDRIIDAMKTTGATAVHPGYGFLSENSEFARRLEAEGLTFIGPAAETIDAMGSKSAAKDLMEAANVPTTPGYQGADQSIETFRTEADRIGYPVLLKATAGGGGKGMRLVERAGDLEEALLSAQREAKSAFGDDRFLIEKYIARARHVEVQIFGDGNGNVVHMFERDCSVQRRHQKIIEEAPAPNLPADVRERLLIAGVEAGKAVNYRGAGTVEFLYDGDQAVYFMEMNTRLQVEHPVSEMITGLDFVEWQLRIAANEPLPLPQDAICENGHAFEARLYAENPNTDFSPSIGILTTLKFPKERVRIDSGVEERQEISPFYDPMIAKLITHSDNRSSALGQMRQALRNTYVAGVETNRAFLHSLTSHGAFCAGEVSTRFIEDHSDALFPKTASGPVDWAAALLWQAEYAPQKTALAPAFRLNQPATIGSWLEIDGAAAYCSLKRSVDGYTACITPGATAADRRAGSSSSAAIEFSFSGHMNDEGHGGVTVDGVLHRVTVADHLTSLRVWRDGHECDIGQVDPLAGPDAAHASEGSLIAPMPGVITALLVENGDAVSAGAPLLVMEAMKMEHTIKAPSNGKVVALHFSPGDQVKDGEQLLEFEKE